VQIANSIEYAIHGLTYVAVAGFAGRAVLLRDTASAIRVPESYLRKVFQALTKRGIVKSQRGVNGGYSLGRGPAEISLRDVVEAVEGPLLAYSCLNKQRDCYGEACCLIKDTFRTAASRVAEVLEQVTLEDIVKEAVSRGSRAAWLVAAPTSCREERMDHQFCPGAKLLRQPKPELTTCPYCREEVEIWSDEIKATCTKCGRTLMREGNMSCLEWCNYGRECVGDAIYDSYVARKAAGLKKKLLDAVGVLFGAEDERTRHARAVVRIAEEILGREKGDPNIVIPASLLRDVGPAEGRSAGERQREILRGRAGLSPRLYGLDQSQCRPSAAARRTGRVRFGLRFESRFDFDFDFALLAHGVSPADAFESICVSPASVRTRCSSVRIRFTVRPGTPRSSANRGSAR